MKYKTDEEYRKDVLQIGREAILNEIKKQHKAKLPVCFEVNGTIVWQLPNGDITMKEPSLNS